MALGVGLLGSTFTVVGCTRDNGQTGSPFGDGPPYDVPGVFVPEGEGQPSIGVESDPGLAGEIGKMVRNDHLQDDRLYVLEANGFSVFDVSGTDTILLGELSIPGGKNGLVVSGDRAIAVVEEPAQIDAVEIPKESQPAVQLRLVLLDISDPTAPKRLSSEDISGQIWDLSLEAGELLVWRRLLEQRSFSCGATTTAEREEPVVGMMAEVFSLVGDELVPGESVSLPGNRPYAFHDEGLLVSFEEGDEYRGGGAMHYALREEAGFSEPLSFTVDATPTALVRDADATLVLLEDGRVQKHEVGANGTAPAEFVPSARATGLRMVAPGALAVTLEAGGALLLDTSEPGTLSELHQFDAEVAQVLSSDAGLVAVGPAGDGSVVVQLFDVSEPGSPTSLARIASEALYVDTRMNSLGGPCNLSSEVSGEQFFVLGADTDSVNGGSLLSFSVAGGGLEQTGFQKVPGFNDVSGISDDGDTYFRSTTSSLIHFPAPDSAVVETPSVETVNFWSAPPLDDAEFEGITYHLLDRDEDHKFVIVDAANPETALIELSHSARALEVVDGYLVATGFSGADAECEEWASPVGEGEAAEGLPPACGPDRDRGISVISLGETPQVVETFDIARTTDASPDWPEEKQRLGHAYGYFRMTDDTLVFIAPFHTDCDSIAECEELGTHAFESVSSPGCNPDTQDCNALPRETVSHGGSLSTSRFYALTVGENPRFSLDAEILGTFDELHGERDLENIVIRRESEVGLPRTHWAVDLDSGDAPGEDSGVQRFYLERLRMDEGELEISKSVNTPGLPVGWTGEQILSVMPRILSGGEEDEDEVLSIAATLVRSELRGDLAFVEETVELQQSLRGHISHDGTSYLSLGPTLACSEGEDWSLLAAQVSPAEIVLGEPLDVPTKLYAPYQSDWIVGDQLRLGGGTVPGAFIYFDLSEPLSPEVSRYVTEL